ncbi:hypothetical protein ACWGH8_12285 [Nonomuraea muscovyensis]|uniref:Uncharacterized protein n=1 Tax=Nonomuraea muscovyensis TaxID=1124761 RepID=A0A7X0EZT2_9ACTN|nr:hypothetical protein [Nonomuraea muscovyensis]MBB6350552.1 hypothetical protein [Nonomuraea muscovyensis]MDF2711332.1 hypothetical protein [Nonomuraea muscovyensis]
MDTAASPVTPGVTAPRWTRWVAHTIAVAVLPSSLWRLGMAMGFPLGYTTEGFAVIRPPGVWGPLWLVLLSIMTEGAALLSFGLVHGWGEVFPRWIPLVGGSRVPRLAVLIPAWAGVVVLAGLWTPFVFWWQFPDPGMTEAGHTLVGFLYLPLVAWAPLLAALVLSYQRRT